MTNIMSTLLQELIASKIHQARALEDEAAAIEALPADQQSTNLNAKRLAALESARQLREWVDLARMPWVRPTGSPAAALSEEGPAL